MNAISLYANPSESFTDKISSTEKLLRQVSIDYAPTGGESLPVISQASSLGAEDMIISHLINKLDLNIEIFILNTGQLHLETLDLLNKFQKKSKVNIDIYHPVEKNVVNFVTKNGPKAMYDSIELRKSCCYIRKVEPLFRALQNKKAWITGLRREQSEVRSELTKIDRTDAITKINPLADWTWGDVWHFISTEKIDYNSLHDAFYPSIGCAPCTRAVSAGEDARSGRWWWESKSTKECGLHELNIN